MATGIPTGNILQPGEISLSTGANRALVSQLQLLKPQWFKEYVEKYGNEDFTWFCSTFGGMEEVHNQQYFWFENRGKLMPAVTNLNNVSAPVNTSVVFTLSPGDHFNSGTQSPLRVGETLRVASSNIEGEVTAVSTVTAGAFTATVVPKQITQGFSSAGSTSLLAGEILIFGGDMDAGEASANINPLIHLDQQYLNTITEMRESWSATDLAEMTEVYYDSGVTGDTMAGGLQAGTSLFTYKGLVKSNTRFRNNVENKLMRGNTVTNTAANATSVGSLGVIPKINTDGETVGYTPGNLDIAKLHEITRIMDVNGGANQVMWLCDIYLRQDFSDGIFQTFPAGAFVWGKGEASEDASVAYGFQNIKIDDYLFQVKKYRNFNTEFSTGKTPGTDFFRNYGLIIPQGTAMDYKDSTKIYKNFTVMFQQPPAGGTVGNGIRVWEWGGGSRNPSNGTMQDQVEMITYRGSRIVAANQFIQVEAA
jgi:hypothetical protein